MKDILPIGTVIGIENRLLMIIGYDAQKVDETVIHYYGVVPYPLGFMDKESLLLFPMDRDFEVVKKGYDSDQFQKYIKDRKHFIETTSKITVTEWEKAVEEMNHLMREMEGA